MKKAVTLAAIAGLTLASDFEDSEFMTQLPSKPMAQKIRPPNRIFFDDELHGTESRSKLTIFNKKKGESEKNEARNEADDELMTVMEYLNAQPKLISIPEKQILDVRTRVPIVSVIPIEQPKTEEEENHNQVKRSNFSIFDRKEGEKTDEKNDHGKSATRSNFSILHRREVNSHDAHHAKRDLEALFSKLLRHKYFKSDNDLYGLRDLKKGGDKDSHKVNVLKLDSEQDNDLYGYRDWKKGDRDSGKAGILGLDSEEDNALYGLRDWRRGDRKGDVLGLDSEEDNDLYGLRDWRRGDRKGDVLGLDSEEDNDLYGLRDWKRGDRKGDVLGLDDEDDNEFRVLGNLIHDGLEIYRDVKNKDYGKVVSHGIKAAQDVHELTRKRNFLGH